MPNPAKRLSVTDIQQHPWYLNRLPPELAPGAVAAATAAAVLQARAPRPAAASESWHRARREGGLSSGAPWRGQTEEEIQAILAQCPEPKEERGRH